jgi:hypothetical protein
MGQLGADNHPTGTPTTANIRPPETGRNTQESWHFSPPADSRFRVLAALSTMRSSLPQRTRTESPACCAPDAGFPIGGHSPARHSTRCWTRWNAREQLDVFWPTTLPLRRRPTAGGDSFPPVFPRDTGSSCDAALRSFRRGLENRCGPYGPPRVRIPPPPLPRPQTRSQSQIGDRKAAYDNRRRRSEGIWGERKVESSAAL